MDHNGLAVFEGVGCDQHEEVRGHKQQACSRGRQQFQHSTTSKSAIHQEEAKGKGGGKNKGTQQPSQGAEEEQ